MTSLSLHSLQPDLTGSLPDAFTMPPPDAMMPTATLEETLESMIELKVSFKEDDPGADLSCAGM